MNSRKKDLKDRIAGLRMPPKRAPAKEVGHHHSTDEPRPSPSADEPLKRVPSVVDRGADAHAKTMAVDPKDLPSSAGVETPKQEKDEKKTKVERVNGNGKKGDKDTAPGKPNARKKQPGEYDEIYVHRESIAGEQIFGNHRYFIQEDIIIPKKPELKNIGATWYRIRLECSDNRIRLVRVEPEEVSEILDKPIRIFLENRGQHTGSDLSSFRCCYDFKDELKYPTHNFSEEEIKAPVMRTTSSGKPVQVPVEAEGSSLMRITPAFSIEIGNPYKLPDKNGYVLFAKGNEYQLRLIEEDEFSYSFSLSKRKAGKKELKLVGEFEMDKTRSDAHAGIPQEGMWITLTRHKNGERSIAVLEWNDLVEDQEARKARFRAPKIVTAVVSAASAATLLFLPEIADLARGHFDLIRLPESVNVDYIGSIPLRTYLAATAALIAAMGALIYGLTGRARKGESQ